MIIRTVIVSAALAIGLAAFAVVGLAVNYDETPHCIEGSPLANLTGCTPGNGKPIIDPRP